MPILSDSITLRRFLHDVQEALDDNGGTYLCKGIRELIAAVEASPVELSIYADRDKRLRIRAKRTGPGAGGATIEARFAAFHEANPHVYEAIVRRFRALQDQGVRRTSVKAAIENLRWSAIGTRRQDSDNAFKIPNNYASRYARLIAEREPELGEMIEIHVIRTP